MSQQLVAGFRTTRYIHESPLYRYAVVKVETGGVFVPGLITKTFAFDYEQTWTPGTPFVTGYETLDSFQERLDANVVMNADSAANNGIITGLQIKDGVMYHDFSGTPKGRHTLGILASGEFRIYDELEGSTGASVLADGVTDTFTFGPPLVRDGVEVDLDVVMPESTWGGPYGARPRTILGQSVTGDIILIAIEGDTVASPGAGGEELCRLARAHGCHQALLLDGGGSTQLWVNRKVVVQSSDTNPRAVPSVLSLNVAVPPNNDITPKPSADCEVWIDGQRAACTASDLEAGLATVLDGLSMNWGRATILEQPGVGTCSFKIRDNQIDDSPDLLSMIHVGSTADVYASATIPSQGDESIMIDGSFEGLMPGPVPGSRAHLLGGTAASIVPGGVDGVQALQFQRDTVAAAPAQVVLPPMPFEADGLNPDAWDYVARIRQGDEWHYSVSVKLPPGRTGHVVAVPYAGPWKSAALDESLLDIDSTSIPGDLQWHRVTGTIRSSSPEPVWVGLGVLVTLPSGEAWNVQPPAETWADQTLRWMDYEVAYVDNVEVLVPNVTERRVLVFSGHVTDATLRAANSDTAVEIDITAADYGASLENDTIGDEPWPQQTVGIRASRINELARLDMPLNVDPGLAEVTVAARDVDAQPVLGLLQDLAQSAGGTLWTTTHATLGPYLWMEDPQSREAVLQLELQGGVIVVAPTDAHAAIISARDVLRDPVEWNQSVAEVVTAVNVRWMDQVVGEDYVVETVERTATATDEIGIETYGLRRLSVSTELTTAQDALALSEQLLRASRGTDWKAQGYTIDFGQIQKMIPTVTNTDRTTALMDMLDGTTRIGLALLLIELPTYTPTGVEASAYLEGGNYTYSNGSWSLDLTISPSMGQGHSAEWEELPPAWRWTDLDPALTWKDIYGATAPALAPTP